MTDLSALDVAVNIALIVGGILLLIYKDVESAGDPRQSWGLNAVLAFCCAVYIWHGDAVPLYRAKSTVATLAAWGMTSVWIGHAIWHLGLLARVTDEDEQPQLLPLSLGIATTALIALLEELTFRGWLQNIVFVLTYVTGGQTYGIFAINLLFGLMHYNRGFIFAMSAGFVGTIFSIATLASGSLLPAIVMHVGWNVLIGLARLRPHQIVESAG